ncbi:putative 2OG-Fe(II) oxygenase [Sphingomonas sp.]|uniref:2OG-Fe(II) oxygenase family protein n=1 Tax=Sphingomonas sp. TaxID=28214 RepID=UPI0031D034E0
MAPHDPELAIDAALRARDAGLAEEGVPILAAALARHRDNARLWHVLGLMHRALGDAEQAARAFGEAARRAPNDLKAAHGLAQASLEAGYPAFELFERARLLAPADADLLIGRAAAQLAEGRGDAAVADLALILANNPLWIAGHATFARISVMLDGGATATQSLEAAVARLPREAALWTELLNVLIEASRFAEADAALRRAEPATGIGFERFEAVIASELGDGARADRLFAALADVADTAHAVRHVRHLLRMGEPELAAARIEPLLDRPDADQLWPYAALAWRLTGDARAEWLEGDARLVGVYDLGEAVGDLDALAGCLRSLHGMRAPPLGQSVRGGTQTDGPLFARAEPEIRRLRAAVLDAVATHVAQLPPPDPRHPTLRHRPARLRFAGAWSVRLTSGGRHSNHVHPLGWLSSAFYVHVPSEIEMGPAPRGWLALGQAPHELGIDLPALRLIEPRRGRLVLFPSTMWHGTLPFDRGERLTVAFDVACPV